jgi:hypothetical protein
MSLITKEEAIHVIYAEVRPAPKCMYLISLGYDHAIGKTYLLEDLILLNRKEVTDFVTALVKLSNKYWICTTVKGEHIKEVLVSSDHVLAFYLKDQKICWITPWNTTAMLPYSKELSSQFQIWKKDEWAHLA